jgi:hypothetical protein
MYVMYTRAHLFFLSFQALLQGGELRAQIWLREFLLLLFVYVCVFFLVLKPVTQHAFLWCCGRWKLRLGRCKRLKNGERNERCAGTEV